MEIFLTLSSGILVFVVGQLIIEAFLKPILEQREVIGTIIAETLFYSNATNSDLDKHTLSSPKIRGLASKLTAKTNKILLYQMFSVIGFVHKRKNIEVLEGLLIGLSNSGMEDEGVTDASREKLNQIKQILKIKR